MKKVQIKNQLIGKLSGLNEDTKKSRDLIRANFAACMMLRVFSCSGCAHFWIWAVTPLTF
jgi:hypothetical protein